MWQKLILQFQHAASFERRRLADTRNTALPDYSRVTMLMIKACPKRTTLIVILPKLESAVSIANNLKHVTSFARWPWYKQQRATHELKLTYFELCQADKDGVAAVKPFRIAEWTTVTAMSKDKFPHMILIWCSCKKQNLLMCS